MLQRVLFYYYDFVIMISFDSVTMIGRKKFIHLQRCALMKKVGAPESGLRAGNNI
jgi:hypothetical protein